MSIRASPVDQASTMRASSIPGALIRRRAAGRGRRRRRNLIGVLAAMLGAFWLYCLAGGPRPKSRSGAPEFYPARAHGARSPRTCPTTPMAGSPWSAATDGGASRRSLRRLPTARSASFRMTRSSGRPTARRSRVALGSPRPPRPLDVRGDVVQRSPRRATVAGRRTVPVAFVRHRRGRSMCQASSQKRRQSVSARRGTHERARSLVA